MTQDEVLFGYRMQLFALAARAKGSLSRSRQC
jgi:hypothetical protein